MRQVLERSHLVLAQGTLAADQQHRAFGPEGIGDAGDRIGRAGPSSDHCTPWRASDARIPIGGMRCDLFVTHIDNLDPLVETSIIDVDDVSATQREDGVDPFMFQGFGHQMPPRNLLPCRLILGDLLTSVRHDSSPLARA